MVAHAATIGSKLGARLRSRADQLAPPKSDSDLLVAFPNDPVGFGREVLGSHYWSRQEEIVASAAAHSDVAIVSGHKVGKTKSLVDIALWFYNSFPGSRVIMTANTEQQLQDVLWRELRMTLRNAKIEIPGGNSIALMARNGLKNPYTFSEIVGFTAKEAEAAAGRSGSHILYLPDEASGIGDHIYEAMQGNRAAGATTKLIATSNPTRASGWFYDAFHSKSALYHKIHIDSRETPNCTGAEPSIPGLADPQWVARMIQEYGEDHPIFAVRVKGDFIASEVGKIFPLAAIADAQMRWAETQAIGRLHIGIDPAGDGTAGDRTVFAWRRGLKVLDLREHTGLGTEAILAHLLGLLLDLRTPDDKDPPVVALDSDGEVGAKVFACVNAYQQSHPHAFVLVRIRGSEKAVRQPNIYDRVRDELWINGRDWLKQGGALPPHPGLEKELHCAAIEQDQRRVKVTDKREMRKLLGRSPDLADAVLHCLWEPLSLRAGYRPPASRPATIHEETLQPILDPYGGLNPWQNQG